jgi:hypothetical protein
MSDSFKRFVLNDDGNIFDSANRFTPSPVCNCEASQGRDRNEPHQQIYLRRCVLRTQLSFLSEKVDFLCEPETYSLAQVVYWTIYVSKLDWTIGQVAFQNSIERGLDESPDASADRMLLSPFLDEVEHLLRDLYGDCDQVLLDDLLESIQIIVCQWERARTASSRSFFERLSQRVKCATERVTIVDRAWRKRDLSPTENAQTKHLGFTELGSRSVPLEGFSTMPISGSLQLNGSGQW